MHRAINFILVFFCSIICSFGQKSSNEQKTQKYKHQISSNNFNSSINKYIPEGYEIFYKTIGNLNLDTIPDVILIIHKIVEDTLYNPAPKRILLILIGQTNGTYKLMYKSENIVFSHDMGGVSNPEPFEKITIDNGYFTVNHFGGMGSFHWEIAAIFRYVPNEKMFYLDKEVIDAGKESEIASEIKNEKKILTTKDFGKVSFLEYNIYNRPLD